MPFVDEERGVVVLRIVYDGPPFSGKTTTLRTLGRSLGVDVFTPAEERGRTLFFDWAEYIGGLFDGRRIRCQIVSVPGQSELAARRQLLLDSADAVIFVADTRRPAAEESFELLRKVVERSRATDPPVGIVLSANKRDDPESMPLEDLRARLREIGPIALKETIATDGDGVREAFVFGVRLALDRLRVLAGSGELRVGRPDIDAPEELLARLRTLGSSERPAPSDVAVCATPASGVLETTPGPWKNASPDAAEIPFAPDPLMPGGFIWPPVDGRTLLHEIARVRLTARRGRDGGWWASGGGWRFHSAATALYRSAQAGRSALIAWARMHATRLQQLSSGRVLILADAGGDRHRLWQLQRGQPSLRETLETSALAGTAEQAVDALRIAAGQLARARDVLAEPASGLPCSLWTIACEPSGRPIYVGLMPSVDDDELPLPSRDELLEREFTPVLQLLRREREDFPALVRLLSGVGDGDPDYLHARVLARVGQRTLSEWYRG